MDKDSIGVNRKRISLWRFILPAATSFLHAKLDQKQFVKAQAAAGRCQGRFIFRVVDV